MEVTSHALDQGRVDNISFDAAIFTNLTLDHLDYHTTMEKYCAAKRRLFQSLKGKKKKNGVEKTAIVNADSPWTTTILEGYLGKVISYGIDCPADLQAKDISLAAGGTAFTLMYEEKAYLCRCPLIGKHNVYNYLAAAATGLLNGAPLETIIKHLKTIPAVPGRLEAVPNALDLHIFVDFAHTDDALTNVLKCLRELTPHKLITVFGCGGDRDRSKRTKMAQASEEHSDFSIVTSDNPRSENPMAICQEVAQGFKYKSSYTIEVDRQSAIEKAISMATPQDIILIAGKGHEPYQIFAHKTIEFDDRKAALQACTKRESQCCA
jgi:UDP-N-acetylmuramoyl-L-alanyl-D-glutamate--2,6-diaminopimelate ligase